MIRAPKWILALLVLGIGVVEGQNVTITGKAVDPNGAPFYTGKAQLVSGNGSGPQSWTFGGTNPVNPTRPISGLDAYGNFSIDLMNTSLIDQQSAQPEWQFNFCSSGTPAPVVCFNVPAMALTSSQSITAQINAVPPPLIPGSSANINLASPPPIGNVAPNTGQFTVLNKVINPLTYPGSDVGAKINAAITANSCSATSPCRIVLPPSPQLSFASTITLPSSTTLECTQSSYVDNKTVSNQTLNYTGSSVALQIVGSNVNVIGCDIALGSSATKGMWLGSNSVGTYSDHITNSTVYGGGSSTILYHISGQVEDAHLEVSRCSNFVGICVQVDHANDVFLEHDTAYGTANNTTGITLLLDSGAGGIQITDFVGGNSGLHGLVMQQTLGGANPTWIFAKGFITDLATGDGWVFDSSLGTGVIGATFMDSWSTTASTGGSCVQINGGSEIHFSGNNRFRACAKSGINVNSTGAGLQIIGNMIQANNISNAGYSGIDIAGHPSNVQIIGNFISNYPETGNQAYFLHTTSDVEALTVIGNDCSYNVTGCALTSSVTTSKLTFFGQSNQGATVASAMPGAFTVNGLATVNGGIQMGSATMITGFTGTAVNMAPGAGAVSDLAVKNAAQSQNNLQVNDDGSILVVGPLKFSGTTVIDASRNATVNNLTVGGTCIGCSSGLTGTTGSIGGSALLAGACASGTASVTGATVGHPVGVSASDGTLPNALATLSAAVTSSNTVSVQVCAIAAVTPAAKTYNVVTQ